MIEELIDSPMFVYLGLSGSGTRIHRDFNVDSSVKVSIPVEEMMGKNSIPNVKYNCRLYKMLSDMGLVHVDEYEFSNLKHGKYFTLYVYPEKIENMMNINR